MDSEGHRRPAAPGVSRGPTSTAAAAGAFTTYDPSRMMPVTRPHDVDSSHSSIIVSPSFTPRPVAAAAVDTPASGVPGPDGKGAAATEVEAAAAGDGRAADAKPAADGAQSMASNVGLMAGISTGAFVLLLLLSCAVYKYRSREEGTYSLEAATSEYGYEACHGGNGYGGVRKKASKADGVAIKTKKRQTKEWYV